jgi:hypothetical protein
MNSGSGSGVCWLGVFWISGIELRFWQHLFYLSMIQPRIVSPACKCGALKVSLKQRVVFVLKSDGI